jgi:hypothetical protein
MQRTFDVQAVREQFPALGRRIMVAASFTS